MTQYKIIGANNLEMMKNRNQGGNTNEDKFSGFQMLKMDILSIVMLSNKSLRPIFKKTSKTLFFTSLISRVFDISKA